MRVEYLQCEYSRTHNGNRTFTMQYYITHDGIEYLRWEYCITHDGNKIFMMGILYNP